MTTQEQEATPLDEYNGWADYWRYNIGVNVIPADTTNKKPLVRWSEWQDNPIPLELHNKWKSENAFYKGMAITLGRVWHRPDKKGYYLVGIDTDNAIGIREICSRPNGNTSNEEDVLFAFANKTLVEQHKDNPDKAHFYLYLPRPLTKKSSDINPTNPDFSNRLKTNEIPAMEVKCQGSIMICSPSIHKNGHPYEIIGTCEPLSLTLEQADELEEHINNICRKYGLKYLDAVEGNGKSNTQIYDLFKKDTKIHEGHNRHEALLRVMESYISRNRDVLSEEQIKQLSKEWNEQHCVPPLDDREFERQWNCATRFIASQTNGNGSRNGQSSNRDSKHSSEPQQSQSQIVLHIAENECEEFFVDQYRVPYAAVKIRGHIETLPLNGGRFRNWICKVYYEQRGSVPNSESITNALNVLKAKADFKGKTRELHLRVASYIDPEKTIYYDLTNPEWEAVKITSETWTIEKAPIMFRRYNNQQPQVYPSKDYPVDIFDRFMELLNVTGEENKLLLKCSIIASFIPEIPIAILMLHGEQGGAKSTLQELVKMLIDPSSIRTLAFPKDINELIQQLAHNYAAYFDNISRIPDWISDQLCRAVTGSGFSKRQLYTDDDDIIYNFKRRLGFNGINLAATKADLLDRGLIIKLERIPDDKKRELVDIWKEFEKIRPQLLGYIFDILVKVLRMRQSVPIELKKLPRMADFAKNAEIISRCMGNRGNLFLEVYYKNIELQTEELLESSPVATAIVKFMDAKGEWKGSATELLGELEPIALELKINTKSKLWPKSPNVLSRKITEAKTNLREVGILIEKEADPHTRVKVIEIRKVSFESLESFDKQYHPQKEDKKSNDITNDNSDIDRVSFDNSNQYHAQNCTSNDMNDMNDICAGSMNPNNSDYEASQESQNMALPRDISKRGEQSPIATSLEDFENRSRRNRTKISVNATRLNTNHPNLSSLENEGSHSEPNNEQNNIEVYHCKHCEYFTYFERELGKHLVRIHPTERAERGVASE